MPNENSHNALNLSHPNDTENRMHSSSMKNSSGLSSRHHGDRGSQYDGRSGSDDGLPLVSSDMINLVCIGVPSCIVVYKEWTINEICLLF